MRPSGNEVILTPWILDQPNWRIEQLRRAGWQVNAPTISTADQLTRIGSVHRQLAETVSRAASRGARPVSLAGDCCAAIPVLGGLQAAGLHPIVLWLDAHGDFNTHDSTISGFLGGMPLAMMTGRGILTLMKAAGAHPVLDADVFLADARDLDPAERALLKASGVQHLRSVEGILDALPPLRPIYVHLDLDVLDPADAPSMRYSVPYGPSLESLVALGHAIDRTGRLVALSVTLWDLEGDDDGATAKSCWTAVSAFAGAPLLPTP